MKKIAVLFVFFCGMFGLYLVAAPVPIEPVAWTPGDPPAMSGVLSPNQRLSEIERLAEGVGTGPEDTTIGPDGLLYTGYEDGRIVRMSLSNGGAVAVELFANTDGRPLGLQFAANGDLIVADGIKGLLAVSPAGEVRVLTNTAEGEPMIFVDDLDIADDGKVWFSDASQRFGIHDNLLDYIESQKTGRLMSYDPLSNMTQVELRDLGFANGVALSANEDFVLVNETFRQRVMRLWLTGPKAGTSEIFADNLPGHPDNISRAQDGTFWVALVAPRNEALDGLMPSPFWRKVLMRLPAFMRANPIQPFGWVIRLDEEGRVIESLQDPNGHYGTITSVNEHGRYLHFGSLVEAAVGRLALP